MQTKSFHRHFVRSKSASIARSRRIDVRAPSNVSRPSVHAAGVSSPGSGPALSRAMSDGTTSTGQFAKERQ